MQYQRRTEALRCKRAAAAAAVDVSAALHEHIWQRPAGSSAAKAQVWMCACMCAWEGGGWVSGAGLDGRRRDPAGLT